MLAAIFAGPLGNIKELGCNAVWLNPCFESPFLDAGYDVSDYMKVAPRYGTNADLKRLFGEAHKASSESIGCCQLGFSTL